jgi:hypothetical protein
MPPRQPSAIPANPIDTWLELGGDAGVPPLTAKEDFPAFIRYMMQYDPSVREMWANQLFSRASELQIGEDELVQIIRTTLDAMGVAESAPESQRVEPVRGGQVNQLLARANALGISEDELIGILQQTLAARSTP